MNALTRLARGSAASLVTSLATLMLALAACGDERTIAVGGGLDDTGVTAPDAQGDSTQTQQQREIIPLHDASQPLNVRVTMNQPIRVKVVDYSRGGPAADVSVRFTLKAQDVDHPGNASLSSTTAFTDDAGIATVTFRSNTEANVGYTITASADLATPISFDLFVSDAPRGSLKVNLRYEGPVSVKNVHIRLVSGQYTCNQFAPIRPTTDVLGEKTLLGATGSVVTWDNLPESQRFTVFATAESQRGHLAAAGCLDGIVIIPNQQNETTLSLFLLTLNPAGIYDSTSVFDFTGAIPGQLGDLVDEISLLFSSPGQFLINQIKRLAAAYVGQLITDAVFGLFEDAVADVINDWMFNRSPSWVRDILTVGQDLFQIVNRLQLEATLKISKLSNDYYIQGALLWDGVVLYWRIGCAREGQPGYDPNCGANRFSLSAFSNTQFPMDIIEGRFTGSIQDFDQLDIDNHTIKLNYGRLIIFALNELILPRLTGQHTLTGAILSFVNCAGIANGIYFGALSTIGITKSDIENFCTSAITIIVTPVELILGGLALDSQLRMSGHAVLTDTNSDLNVDRIEQGNFIGHFESDGTAGSPFTGTWHAERRTQP